MKKVNLLIVLAIIITALALIFVACNKDQPDPVPQDVTASPAGETPEETAGNETGDPEATEESTEAAETGDPSATDEEPVETPSGTDENPEDSEQPTDVQPTDEIPTEDNTGDATGTEPPADSTATPAGNTPTPTPANPTATASNPTDQNPPANLVALDFPASNTTYSKEFAKQVLSLNMGADKQGVANILTSIGLTVKPQYQVNYDKAADDQSHTAAFTYGIGKVSYKGATRDVLVVVIRSTMSAGEWRSNFDFAPSHDDNTKYSENFLQCAQNVYSYVKPEINKLSNPLVLFTGFSRGAGAANLLGTLYNNDFGAANGFIYTFAAPNTIRNITPSASNVFNIINPADPVTMVPFKSLNYKRAGKDIVLADSQNLAASTTALISHLDDLSKMGIKAMYESKYKLDGPGIDNEEGMTVFELIEDIAVGIGSPTDIDTTVLMKVLGKIGQITEESQLYPFVEFAYEAMALYTSEGMLEKIASQHLPTTYAALLDAS